MTSSPPRSTVVGAPATSIAWVDIPLTQGNIDNAHIYLRTAEWLLPTDAIGGSNRQTAAKATIKVRFDPGDTVSTDVDGTKMILRERGAVNTFFKQSGAKEGDSVRLTRLGSHEFEVTLKRPT